MAANQGSGSVLQTFNERLAASGDLLGRGLNAAGISSLLNSGRADPTHAYDAALQSISDLQKAVYMAGIQSRANAPTNPSMAAIWAERQKEAQRQLDELRGSGAGSIYNLGGGYHQHQYSNLVFDANGKAISGVPRNNDASLSPEALLLRLRTRHRTSALLRRLER